MLEGCGRSGGAWSCARSRGSRSGNLASRIMDGTGDRATHAASAKWYDRKEYVFLDFCIEDSKDVAVKFESGKLLFSCVGGSDKEKYHNEAELFEQIIPEDCKHKRTDRTIHCLMKKSKSGVAWPRLTKEKSKLKWLSVDFDNWKDWEDESDEEMGNFDQFSDMKNKAHQPNVSSTML
ncbi:prostaglandin E synthase 3-like isoform X2 [Petromyzon marinus]|uniref:prostaglandin E synthase 3-like isoform X2 n=1 Tax=Petromyzon marinus TaxID=7757 RepID=UPI003F718B41